MNTYTGNNLSATAEANILSLPYLLEVHPISLLEN